MSENTKNQNSADKMGTAPLLKLIITMSLPSFFSMMVQALYNIVDSIFVSRLGEYALSAVSIVFPIQMLIISVGSGASVGLSSLISRRLGEKNIKSAQSAADHGVYLSVAHWTLFLIFGLFFSNWFCRLFSDSEILYNAANTYCKIVTIGSLFVINSCSTEKVMQACGNVTLPMITMISGAVTNIILDPIMIFGYFGCPRLEVAGAAYATVIGQIVTFVLNIIFIAKAKIAVKPTYKLRKIEIRTIKDIYAVGIPAMIMQAISSVTTLCLNTILTAFSSTYVAVLGVYFKLQSFIFMPVVGINFGIMPIMGYNYGAKNKERLMKTYKYGMIIAFIIMIIGSTVFKTIPAQLMGMFDAEGEMLKTGIVCLKTISWMFPLAPVSMISIAIFQATGHGFYSALVSVLRQLIIIVPLAYIFSKVWGVLGIWWAYPIAETASVIICLLLVRSIYVKKISKF